MEKIEFKEFNYSNHAVQRMFERGLNPSDIEKVIKEWNVITEYPEDKPYESILLLGYSNNIPIHVVAGIDYEYKVCYIITVYQPDPELWIDSFTKRREL